LDAAHTRIDTHSCESCARPTVRFVPTRRRLFQAEEHGFTLTWCVSNAPEPGESSRVPSERETCRRACGTMWRSWSLPN